jgi:hypothetical protein
VGSGSAAPAPGASERIARPAANIRFMGVRVTLTPEVALLRW